jgi:hypothetical protein
MAERIDPITILVTRPPGSCLFGRVQLDAGTWEVAWYIRETSARIAALDRPEIEFRAGAIGQRYQGQAVVLLPILVRIGPERGENLFESWLNVWADDGKGLEELNTLVTQARLTLHFYGESGRRERSLVVSNQLQDFAAEAIARLDGLPAWSMPAFDRARQALEARYPTVEALWHRLRAEASR